MTITNPKLRVDIPENGLVITETKGNVSKDEKLGVAEWSLALIYVIMYRLKKKNFISL